jgi:hypothetical protein
MLAMQIAVGIWAGGLLLIGTVALGVAIADTVAKNKRYGRQWWRGILAPTY